MHRAVVAHIEIVGDSREGLKRFYCRLFGWRINSDPGGGQDTYWIDPASVGVRVSLREATQSSVVPYVEVDDVLENLCYAEELGGRILEAPHEIMAGGLRATVALFADPQGNRVGLSKGWLPWTPA
jgi:predicted enzyme related to lactoylglutathione lyase